MCVRRDCCSNKCSLNPETNPSDGRLVFEKICHEKDKAKASQHLAMAGTQKELIARKEKVEGVKLISLPRGIMPNSKARTCLGSRFWTLSLVQR